MNGKKFFATIVCLLFQSVSGQDFQISPSISATVIQLPFTTVTVSQLVAVTVTPTIVQQTTLSPISLSLTSDSATSSPTSEFQVSLTQASSTLPSSSPSSSTESSTSSGAAAAAASSSPASSSPALAASSSGSNAGAIAGGVIGGLAAVAVIVGLVLFLLRRRNIAARQQRGVDSTLFPKNNNFNFGSGSGAGESTNTNQSRWRTGGAGASHYGSRRLNSVDSRNALDHVTGPLGAATAAGVGAAAAHHPGGRSRGQESMEMSNRQYEGSSVDVARRASGTSRTAKTVTSSSDSSRPQTPSGRSTDDAANDPFVGSPPSSSHALSRTPSVATKLTTRKAVPKYRESELVGPSPPVVPHPDADTTTETEVSIASHQELRRSPSAASGTLGGVFAGEKGGQVHYLLPDLPPSQPLY